MAVLEADTCVSLSGIGVHRDDGGVVRGLGEAGFLFGAAAAKHVPEVGGTGENNPVFVNGHFTQDVRAGVETEGHTVVRGRCVAFAFFDFIIDADRNEGVQTEEHVGIFALEDRRTEIEERLDESFPNFREKLYASYNFSEQEYRICVLIKMGVPPSMMSTLLATSKSNITQSRQRMQQKVFNGRGTAKDWDRFILSL